MRQLPRFEATSKVQFKRYRQAKNNIRKSVARGRPKDAERNRKKKKKAADKGCAAQAKVYEVYELYKAQGNMTAAEMVFEVAPVCRRSFACR